MLFDEFREELDIAPNDSPREDAEWVDFISDAHDPVVSPHFAWDMSDEQGAGVQAPLIFWALKVVPPQSMHNSVIVPKEISSNYVEEPCTHTLRPKPIAEDI